AGRREAVPRGQDRGQPAATAAGPAAAARPGDPAPRRQGALEDRGGDLPAGSPVPLLLLQPRPVAPAAAGLPRRGGLPRHAHRRAGTARRRFRDPRLGIRLQDRSLPVSVPILLVLL